MIPPLFRRPDPTIAVLYGVIVAQARDARFYEDFGVADTVLGRFDLILLHVALALRRIRAGDAAMQALAQGVFDTFCRDMDHNLREMGISDQGVPRHMQRVGEAFYGRAQAYDAALAEPFDGALAEALARNVYAGVPEASATAARLAPYVRRAADELDTQSFADLARGALRFPQPAASQPVAAE